MTLVTVAIWPQPLDPLNSTVLSALVAALPGTGILSVTGNGLVVNHPSSRASQWHMQLD